MDDEHLLAAVLAALTPLGVQTRRLFGSRGLYNEGRFFGFISDGRLYFHTDATTRADYLARDMPAFQPPGRPRGPRTVDRNFEVPMDVVSDPGALVEWAAKAIAASRT
jgi:TfoX/Sxy family transcriptional regulator of competence genes